MNESKKQGKEPNEVVLGHLADDEGNGSESIPTESLDAFRVYRKDIQEFWRNIAQPINDLNAPLAGITEYLNPLSGSLEGFSSILGEGVRSTDQISRVLGDTLLSTPALGSLVAQVKQTTSAFEAWKPLFTRLSEPSDTWFSELEQRFVTNCKLLAERGWFPDPNMPLDLLRRLAITVSEDPSKVDTLFGNHLKGQLTEVEADLIKLSPERARIIQDAFWAHRQGKYSLSIPVFLSQADGLWFDQFKESVFISRDREGTNEAKSTHFSRTRDQLFEALRIASLPIWISERERGRSFSDLNRHQVLHGEVVNYDSEEFSLKAISFLCWLCWTFSNLDLTEPNGN